MGETEYRNVRLTEAAYERLESRKRSGESFSDTVERLAGEQSLLELTGILSDDEADAMRESISESEEHYRDQLDRLTDRINS